MHLYTTSASPNGKRVAVVMKEKNIEIPLTQIDLMAAENLSKEYLAKNPMGRVPVLELDSGFMLAESVAISRYLEILAPEPNLFGIDPEKQCVIEMWHRRAEINLFIPVAQAYRNSSGVFKDREPVSAEWGDISAGFARDAVPVFEQQLASNEYIAGDRYSIADITLAITLTFARNTGLDLLSTPHIAGWHERITARPSFKK